MLCSYVYKYVREGSLFIDWGGEVGRLMANAILNFHFDFLNTSLSRFIYIVPLLFQVGFALQSGLNVIPCFGEKLEEREAGRTMEVETLTFSFAIFEIMDHGGRFSFSYFCRNVFVCLCVF